MTKNNLENRPQMLSAAQQAFVGEIIKDELYFAQQAVIAPTEVAALEEGDLKTMKQRMYALGIADHALGFMRGSEELRLRIISNVVRMMLGEEEPVLDLPGGPLTFDFTRMEKVNG